MTQTTTLSKKLIQTLHGKIHDVPPIWLMRQAGRYLPEYRELRSKAKDFLDFCYTPSLATEATLQPLRRFDLDAAILFSDILVIPHALGQHVTFAENHGPLLGDLPSFDRFDEQTFHVNLSPVYETLTRIKTALNEEGYGDRALIGFSGAPWTLACYMTEGKGSKDFHVARLMALTERSKFTQLIALLTGAVTSYCIRQIEEGAEVIQLFDSWSGALTPNEFEEWVIKPTRAITSGINAKYPDIPVIGFPKGAALNLPAYAKETGVTALSIDQFTPLPWACANTDRNLPLQGNLDPLLLISGGEALEKEVRNIRRAMVGRSHIFNLGHGIDKSTPIVHVEQLVKAVRISHA
ncbi:MAG: uroporphyrinogen decarboxylase [Pseudobdellovibrionaceae bacterium]